MSVADSSVPKAIIVASRKSQMISFLLTLIFGPLGLLYASLIGGLVMLCVAVIGGFFTFGIAAVAAWPICIIWGMISISRHNATIENAVVSAA